MIKPRHGRPGGVAVGIVLAVGLVARAAEPARDGDGRVVGAWQIKFGNTVSATYQFNADHTFVLTFAVPPAAARWGAGGTAGGTWSLTGDHLTMVSRTSETSYTKVGETEEADVVSACDDQLVLRSKDIRGNDERLTFDRVGLPRDARPDNAKLRGTWRSAANLTLVLTEQGLAVLDVGGRSFKGSWAATAKDLVLAVPLPFRAATRPDALPEQRPVRFQIDVLDDTTLVITGGPLFPGATETMTFLRAK